MRKSESNRQVSCRALLTDRDIPIDVLFVDYIAKYGYLLGLVEMKQRRRRWLDLTLGV